MKTSEITPAQIASVMGLTETHLWGLAGNIQLYYKPERTIVKKGKSRRITPPTYGLKVVTRRLHRFIQRELPCPRVVHGGARGRSCFTAARTHTGSAFLITRDMKDCYPSIESDALRKRLLQQGFRSDSARLLSMLMTYRNRVPQGSPISSDALNLFLRDTDRRVPRKITYARRSARFTRTYDDLVISTSSFKNIARFARILEKEIEGHGLQVNERKKRDVGLQPCHKVQLVHGIEVNSRRGVGIRKDQRAIALSIAESYVRSCRSVSPESLPCVAAKRAQLHGWMHFTRQAEFGPAKHLARLLSQGDRLVRSRLVAAGVTRMSKWWVVSKRRNRPAELSFRWKGAIRKTA